MPQTAKTATLDLRVSPVQKDLVRRAASLRGQTMTEFVMSIVEPVATELLDGQDQIRLSRAAWEEFVAMVSSGEPATLAARREAADYLRRVRSGELSESR
jgi:uncharacterized protein (DUF1778 family)